MHLQQNAHVIISEVFKIKFTRVICIYVCMYVCIDVCMYVLMYVLMYDYIYVLFVCRG